MPGSITRWLLCWDADHEIAIDVIWDRVRRTLMKVAKLELSRTPGAFEDEEDMASRAFAQFCQGLRQRKYTLTNRNELFHLLICITRRRVQDHRRKIICRPNLEMRDQRIDDVVSATSNPGELASLADWLDSFFHRLPFENLKQTAMLKLRGFTNREIAAELGCMERSVERRLVVIRKCWHELTCDEPKLRPHTRRQHLTIRAN